MLVKIKTEAWMKLSLNCLLGGDGEEVGYTNESERENDRERRFKQRKVDTDWL